MSWVFEIVFMALWRYMARAGLVLRCCDEPDTSGQVAAAQSSERVGMRSLDLAEKQYATSTDLQREFLDMARANLASDRAVKDTQMRLMDESEQRRQEVFNPLEDSLVREAQAYDSPERVANEMGKADAAVVQAYEKAVGSAGRDQLRFGMNPNSGKALALRENAAVDIAAAAGNAATMAGERTKGKGFGMRMDTAGLGRNLATNQTAAADSSLRAGQSALGSFQGAVDQGNRNFSTAMQGFGTANTAFGTAGNLYGSAAQLEAQGSPMNGLGRLAGMGLSAYAGGLGAAGKTCASTPKG